MRRTVKFWYENIIFSLSLSESKDNRAAPWGAHDSDKAYVCRLEYLLTNSIKLNHLTVLITQYLRYDLYWLFSLEVATSRTRGLETRDSKGNFLRLVRLAAGLIDSRVWKKTFIVVYRTSGLQARKTRKWTQTRTTETRKSSDSHFPDSSPPLYFSLFISFIPWIGNSNFNYPIDLSFVFQCITRVPYATLVAVIINWAGVGVFCGCLYRGVNLTLRMFQDVFQLDRGIGWWVTSIGGVSLPSKQERKKKYEGNKLWQRKFW